MQSYISVEEQIMNKQTIITILRLRHLEGMEMNEIAVLTGSSEVAIRKALSRARQAVRQN